MGAAPSSTENLNIPKYPSNIWKVKNPPTGQNLMMGVKDQVGSYYTYNPECHSCNGNGCDAGICSCASSWYSCGNVYLTNAFGYTYTPSGKDKLWNMQDCEFTCPDKPICSLPNIEECLLGGNSQGEDPTFKADWNVAGKLACSYDLNKFDSANQIFLYKQKFNPDPNDPEFFKLMTFFCSQQSKNCLLDPVTQEQIPTCSCISASGKEENSEICKLWFNGLNQQNRDTVVNYICSKYPQNKECTCNNRFSDPIYNSIKTSLNFEGIEDACVYLPCKGGTPAYILNWKDANPTCPQNVCQTIFNVNNTQGNVDISKNQIYISCPYYNTTNTDKPTTPTNPTSPTNPIPQPTSQHINKPTHSGPINNAPKKPIIPKYVPKNDPTIKKNKIIGFILIGIVSLLLIFVYIKF